MKERKFKFIKDSTEVEDTLISINDNYVIGASNTVPREQVKDFIDLTPHSANFRYGNRDELNNVVVRKVHSPELAEELSDKIWEDSKDKEGIGILVLCSEEFTLDSNRFKLAAEYDVDEDTKARIYEYVED